MILIILCSYSLMKDIMLMKVKKLKKKKTFIIMKILMTFKKIKKVIIRIVKNKNTRVCMKILQVIVKGLITT